MFGLINQVINQNLLVYPFVKMSTEMSEDLIASCFFIIIVICALIFLYKIIKLDK